LKLEIGESKDSDSQNCDARTGCSQNIPPPMDPSLPVAEGPRDLYLPSLVISPIPGKYLCAAKNALKTSIRTEQNYHVFH